MTLTELLDKDQDSLHQKLQKDPSAASARQLISRQMDRLLFTYNGSCTSEELQSLCADLFQTAKASLGFLECAGEPKIWNSRSHAAQEKAKNSGHRRSVILALSGMLALIIVYFILVSSEGAKGFAWTGILLLAGAALLFFAGAGWHAAPKKIPEEQKIEQTVDPDQVLSVLRAAVVVIDHILSQARDVRQQQEEGQVRRQASAVSREEIELYAGLLEAAYSKDGSYALEALGNLPYYLHQKHIEIVDCSADTRDLFDFIPGEKPGTIRPALKMGPAVLKRGLAVS